MAKKYVFDGKEWNKLSPRYQTRRNQEKIKKQVDADIKLKEYREILDSPENYTEEEVRVTKLKYKSLIKSKKIVNQKEEIKDILIPLRIDQKTVTFVKECYIFKSKYVKMFGLKFLKNRVETYKKLLEFKPTDVIYWNPF